MADTIATDAKRLWDEAPAVVRNCTTHHGCACREYVMERLPNYEAAVDALDEVTGLLELHIPADGDADDVGFESAHAAIAAAHAALARLRGES